MISIRISWFTFALVAVFLWSCNDEPPPEPDMPNELEVQPDTNFKPNPFAQKFDTSQVDTTSFEIKDGYIKLTWLQLKKVEFEEKFNDEINAYVPYPTFHPELWYLHGKKVSVTGYYIPIEETGATDEDMVIVSAFPYSNCFFCGGAGPESVVDIHLAKPLSSRIKQDKQVTFRGKLKLNDHDLYYLNYILEDAQLVE